MNPYKFYNNRKTNSLKGRERNEGMCIEREMQLAQTNGIMPEKNMSSVFYTQRKDGVLSSTNIRTDKFEIAQNAMSHANTKFKEKIQENLKAQQEQNNQDNKKID